jgi:hypothetical protein
LAKGSSGHRVTVSISALVRSILVTAVAVLAAILLPLSVSAASVTASDTVPPTDTRPVVTANDFMPTERSLSDCLSVLPKPGCGSEARGGWAQTAVFVALIGGLGVIGTRIVIGIRRRDAALQPTEQN